MNDTVSIIIPAFNCERNIAKCVKSALDQTYRNIEVIVVNDGSKDKTLEILKNKEFNCVKIFNKENGGVSSARNLGLSKASGKYIMFLDADDFLDPETIEILLQNLKKHNADTVIYSYKYGNNGNFKAKKFLNKFIESNKAFLENFAFLFENAFFNSPWNKLYTKNLINSNFDENFTIGEDLIFNLNYFKNVERVVLVDQALYNYTVEDNNSLSSKYDSSIFDQEIKTYHQALKFNPFAKESIDRVFAKEVYFCIRKLVEKSGYDKKTKLKIIKEYVNNEDVQKISPQNNHDKNIKLIFWLIKFKKINLIYYFFDLKKRVRRVIKHENS